MASSSGMLFHWRNNLEGILAEISRAVEKKRSSIHYYYDKTTQKELVGPHPSLFLPCQIVLVKVVKFTGILNSLAYNVTAMILCPHRIVVGQSRDGHGGRSLDWPVKKLS